MEHQHPFIFEQGEWIGKGKVAFTTATDTLNFYTKWEIEEAPHPDVLCIQTVEMEGTEGKMVNKYHITERKDNQFTVTLTNDIIGTVMGTGKITPETITWEFRGQENFDGFEVFERQSDGSYTIHAEYNALGSFKTVIDGILWSRNE